MAIPRLAISKADAPPTIANNSLDADHDVDIGSKVVVADEQVVLTASGGLTKQLDASWSAGTNAGGLDTGSIAADTWYSVWAIAKANKVQDALFSASATSPTLPTDYIYKRRIGWVRTDSSSNILAFRQEGDWFYLINPVSDDNAGGVFTRTPTVTTPPSVLGLFNVLVQDNDTDVVRATVQPTWAVGDWPTLASVKGLSGGTGSQSSYNTVPVDANSQVTFKAISGGDNAELSTVGWLDRRGRDD